MNELFKFRKIYMHMYMYMSVSVYLCSGTISQKKYEIEFRIHCPWHHQCDGVTAKCSLITHCLHKTPVRRPFVLHLAQQGGLMSEKCAHYFLYSFLILRFYWDCRLTYFSNCKDNKGSYSTLIENLFSSIRGFRC